MRSTSWTPSIISISPGSGWPCPTTPSTVRVTPVDRWTSMPISTRRATTCSTWASVARSCITTTIALLLEFQNSDSRFQSDFTTSHFRLQTSTFRLQIRTLAVYDAAFEAARFVDDPFEQPADRLRPQRALARHVAHVLEDLLLALGLIDLDAELLFQLADFAGAARPLVE